MAAAQVQGSSHNNAFKAMNYRVTRSVQEQAAALDEELLDLERAKQEVLLDIAETKELQRLTLLAGMTVPPSTLESNRKKALELSKTQIATSGGFAQWGSMLKAKLQHLEKVKGTIEKVERILKRLGPQALLARNAGVSLKIKGKLEAEITTWMDHLQKYEDVLKARNGVNNSLGGKFIGTRSLRPQMVSTATSMPEQKLATIAITVAQSCNGASSNARCNRTLSNAKALLNVNRNTSASKVVAEVAEDLAVIKNAAPREQDSMIRTSVRGRGKRAKVMLTALMLLGLVSGSSYLLSNAAAVRRNAPNTRNLSTINRQLGNLAPPALPLANTSMSYGNSNYIAAPSRVTDSLNASVGNFSKNHLWPVPNSVGSLRENKHLELISVPAGARNGRYPAALLGGGVLVGGFAAAAAGRLFKSKSNLNNARSGKPSGSDGSKGKKKRLNGVLRDLMDAPVSAGVRSRRR